MEKKVILPLWFPMGGGTNPLWAEGWDSCLQEVIERLEAAGIPFETEKKFGAGRVEQSEE